jgi:hypothetical protein
MIVRKMDIKSELPIIRNVWSAALLQAKREVTSWYAQMYTAFVGSEALLATMECAAPFFHLTMQS